MDLILWRHAEAEDGSPDLERRLTAKGLKQADRMAAWLRERLPADRKVFVSPATRTQQTASALTHKFETSEDFSTSTTPEQLLRAAGWLQGHGTAVVVGHQPTLGAAAALILTGRPLAWHVRKGSIWWITRRHRERQIVLKGVMAPDLL